jgi:hypothetical protein
MRFATMVMLAGIGLGCCTLARAGGQAEQGGWTEAQSLRELPAGIQALLGVGLGADGIADRGEDFNEGALRADNMPARRFALGIVNGDTAMVAVEQGGRAYVVSAVEFRQAGSTWDAVRCASMNELPRRGAELADVFSGRRAGPCRDRGMRTAPPGLAPAGPAAGAVQRRVRPRPGA